MTLTTGAKLGPYEIAAPLGAGGMGEVYRAKDSRLGREVAIKVLPESTAKDPEALARFEREAKAVAALSHPNILALHDVGNENGVAYAVMELLEGETLRARLTAGMIPPRKLTDFARQIAEGLAAAHEKGIIHRDLKPENLWVTPDGRMKILDFGLAKLQAGPGAPASGENTPTRSVGTEPGVTLGTAGYMSPEQVRGEPADHRSDIFSFGAVLYEMASGKRAFKKNSAVETMSAILNEEPPELSLSAPVAPGLERIIRHCLEKNAVERFQSARDLAFDLSSLSGTTGGGAPIAVGAGRMKQRRTALVAAAGFALLAGAFWFGRRSSTPSTEGLTFSRLTFQRNGFVTAARFAPDGKGAIYSMEMRESGESRLFRTEPGNPESLPVSPLDAALLAISSKGEMAVRLRTVHRNGWIDVGVLARMPAGGGAPREILESVQEADWAPDGESLAVTVMGDLHCRLEYPIGTLRYETDGWVSAPSIAPDGKRLAFVDHPYFGDDRGAIALIDRDGKKRLLTPVFESVQGLHWDADGKRLWTSASHKGNNRSLLTVGLDGAVRKIWTDTAQAFLFDRAADGRLLFGSGEVTMQLAGKLAGDAQERDYSWLDWTRFDAISPDGASLLFTEQGEGGGPGYAVYLARGGGDAPVRLGRGQGLGFSPDGKSVWAIRLADGPTRITVIPVGPGEAREIGVEGVHVQTGLFCHTGKELLLIGNLEGRASRTWRVSIAGGKPAPVSEEQVIGYSCSQDGKWLLARDMNKDEWRLLPLDGGAPRGVSLPAPPSKTALVKFTPDAGAVFFMGKEPATRNIVYKVNLASGRSEPWHTFNPVGLSGGRPIRYVLGNDGISFAHNDQERTGELYLATSATGR